MSQPSSRSLPPRPTVRRGQRAAIQQAEREGLDPSVIAALPSAVVMLDGRGAVLAWSEALTHLLRLDAPLLRGARLFDQLTPRAAYEALEADVRASLEGGSRTFTRELELEGDPPRSLQARGALAGTSSTPTLVLTFDDVGGAREAERTRERNQSFLLHDLKSPLWSILINLPVARDALPPGETRDAVEDSLAEAERLRRMIVTLQDLHRSDNGALPIDKAPVDVVKIARDALDSATRAAEIQGIDLEIEGPPWLVANVDAILVRRMLDNLVGNALRFAKSVVRVKLEEGPPLVIRVADDGHGIPPEQRDRIFERFARAANPSGRGDNAGLGLTFCRIVARGHGGDIRADEAEGGGAEFVVTLG